MKSLTIKNLVLIEEVHIDFPNGFTVITGETGAGKTALIEALHLLTGERADASKLRKSADKGLVQGVFDPFSGIESLFDSNGLLWDPSEELIIMRELNRSGKSRAFVCGQQVPLTFLQQLGANLIDFIGQHASLCLKSSQTQRELLDLYGQIDTTLFAQSLRKERELADELAALKEEAKSSEKQKAFLQAQVEELQGANVQEGEFEQLFSEYELLAGSQEILALLQSLHELTDEALEKTGQLDSVMSKASKSHAALQESSKLAETAHVFLSEIYSELQKIQGRLESDPHRLQFLEERLKLLNQLKKKYGSDVRGAQNQLEQALDHLESLNETISKNETLLSTVKKTTQDHAQTLTSKRKKTAKELGISLTQSIRELNIPHGTVTITLNSISRSQHGDDEVCFWLQANPGENPSLLKDSTSGGELSRLFFALKTALNTAPTLVFDEIDANVGGETATVIGQKLKSLGRKGQVLCITHFPQVASQADHHLRVYKEEKKDRTVSQLDLLNPEEIDKELFRMLGGQSVTVIT